GKLCQVFEVADPGTACRAQLVKLACDAPCLTVFEPFRKETAGGPAIDRLWRNGRSKGIKLLICVSSFPLAAQGADQGVSRLPGNFVPTVASQKRGPRRFGRHFSRLA